MNELIFLVEEDLEGGYSARALNTPIFTQGDTMDELRENVRDAVECHFPENKPAIIRLHIVKEEVLSHA